MLKYSLLLMLIISTYSFAGNEEKDNYDSYLLFSNNGLALNGVHSADTAINFAEDNNIIPWKFNQYKFQYENVIIDLQSSVNYSIHTKEEKFYYNSDSKFFERLIDRVSLRKIVFNVQHIGDYLLFLEDYKITCFNLKLKKPCDKIIAKEIASFHHSNGIIMKELYFYRNKRENVIFTCTKGIGFAATKPKAICEGKNYIALNKLMN